MKERIVLHLFDYARYAEAYEVPADVTQDGIARAAGIYTSHVQQYVRPLLREELVSERTSHVQGGRRQRKAYLLTERGRHHAATLRGELFRDEVPLLTRAGETRAVPFSQVYQETRRGTPLLQLLGELREGGAIREATEAKAPALVEVAPTVPKVERFWGRRQELDEVVAALERTPVVVVTGMAGIGKTTFASKVGEAFRGRRSIFRWQLQPWDTALGLAARVAAFLAALGRTELDAFLKEPGPKDLGAVEERLAKDLAGRPVLLVLDDVHRAAGDTPSFLAVLLRALRGHKEASALLLSRAVPEFYSRREVAVDGLVAEVALRGLAPEDSAALLAGRGVPAADVDRLVAASGGSPLFLLLLASARPEASSGGWGTVEAYIAEQIEPALADGEREAVELASLVPFPVPAAALEAGGGAGRRDLLRLVRKGLLQEAEDRYALHDTLRAYFLQALPATRREARAKAVTPWLVDEAERLASAGKPEDAVPYLEAAVGIQAVPRPDLFDKLGRMYLYAGDDLGAIEAFRTGLRVTEDPRKRARFHEKVAACLGSQTRLDEAERELEEAFRILPPEPTVEGGWVLYRQAAVAAMREDFAEALEAAERGLAWIPHIPAARGVVDLHASLAMARGHIRLKDAARQDYAAAITDFRRAIELWDTIEDRQGPAIATVEMGEAVLAEGDAKEAIACFESGAGIAEEIGDVSTRLEALLGKARALSELAGDHEAAERILAETFAAAKEKNLANDVRLHLEQYARLYDREGRVEEAREAMEHFLRASAHRVNAATQVEDLAYLARLCARCEDLDAARRHLGDAEAIARAAPTCSLEWAKAVVEARAGDAEAAAAGFRKAVELSSGRAEDPGRAELLLDYGRFLAASGEKKEAAQRLAEAQALADRFGRKPIAVAAKAALEPLVTPRKRA